MRITNMNIDALIDVSIELNRQAESDTNPLYRNMHLRQCHHVRKIYLLLLQASGRDREDLRQLCFTGISDELDVVTGIKRLCPTALEPHEVDPSAGHG